MTETEVGVACTESEGQGCQSSLNMCEKNGFSTVAHTLCEVEGQGYSSLFDMRQNDCTGFPLEMWLYTGK